MKIICYGICSENCEAMINGKCILEAEKEENEKQNDITTIIDRR